MTAASPDAAQYSGAPRVEAVIEAVMAQHKGTSAAALARYFEAVHQELAPLARELERETIVLRAEIDSLNHQLRTRSARRSATQSE
ncbi:hypothetical protein ACTXHA_03925 [Burkholderia cenocepacia]